MEIKHLIARAAGFLADESTPVLIGLTSNEATQNVVEVIRTLADVLFTITPMRN